MTCVPAAPRSWRKRPRSSAAGWISCAPDTTASPACLPPSRSCALEKQAVLVSLENLMTFPFVRDAVADDRLTVHGLWNNTGEGALEQYDPARGFVPV